MTQGQVRVTGQGQTITRNDQQLKSPPCLHFEGHWPNPYSEDEAKAQAAEVLKELDTHTGDDELLTGLAGGPPNPCGPHKIITLDETLTTTEAAT